MTALADAAPSTECTEAARRIVTVMAGTREFTKLNDRVVQRSLLRLALKADHGGMVADLLAALQAEGGDPDVMGDILASGNAVRVSNLAVDINTVYYSSEFVSGKVTFDARVDAALAAVLPTIDPPALRLRFELSAHCLPSAPGMKPRVERLQEIARRLSPLLDSLDASALNNDLELLAVEPAAALLLRRCYDERCPEEEWAGILRQSADPSAGNVWTFWMIGLFADAAEPNLPQLSKRATAFQIKSGAFLYYACAGISHGWPQWKQETRSEVERWLRATLDKSSNLLTEEGREALRKLPAELHTAVKIYF